MGPRQISFGRRLLGAQIGAAVLGPLLLALVPPATGAMLLIPTGHANAVVFARAHGALLVAPGLFAGSIVVSGERARLLGYPWTTGMLVVAATPGGCGVGAVRAP